jgi:hypothetical protein
LGRFYHFRASCAIHKDARRFGSAADKVVNYSTPNLLSDPAAVHVSFYEAYVAGMVQGPGRAESGVVDW